VHRFGNIVSSALTVSVDPQVGLDPFPTANA